MHIWDRRMLKDFINDLYNGNLLADVAQEHKDNLDRTKKGPTLEDLLREEEEERREIEAAKKIEELHAGGLAADQDEMDAEEAAARMDKMLEEED